MARQVVGGAPVAEAEHAREVAADKAADDAFTDRRQR